MKRGHYTWMLGLIFLLCLQACSRESSSAKKNIVKVESQSVATTLYYSGSIQPLQTVVVPSPADGVVIDMPFQYGEKAKAGELLFTISSAKFLADYKSALMAYIKAKSDFNNGQTQLSEAQFLHKNELISDDDFKSKQANFYASQLALLQAKDTLENLLRQLNAKNVDLYKLTIADIDKITQALHLQSNTETLEHLRIVSPLAGTILSSSKGEDDNKKVMKGDAVKQGDVLAVIGDMTGISVKIKVSELTLNQLKVGQKVSVTGIAFPDHVLAGEIKRIDKQGEPASGGLPTFSVQVVVPHLTKEQQKEIHVGMSAKVDIIIENEPQVMIPIRALIEKKGQAYVRVQDRKTTKAREVLVKTGKTTLDSVAILSGLKTGDEIVIPD
jgi:HlyD family secretion protein